MSSLESSEDVLGTVFVVVQFVEGLFEVLNRLRRDLLDDSVHVLRPDVWDGEEFVAVGRPKVVEARHARRSSQVSTTAYGFSPCASPIAWTIASVVSLEVVEECERRRLHVRRVDRDHLRAPIALHQVAGELGLMGVTRRVPWERAVDVVIDEPFAGRKHALVRDDEPDPPMEDRGRLGEIFDRVNVTGFVAV